MKYLAGFIVLAAIFQPYFVWGDAAAAAASSSKGGGAAAAAASSSNGGGAAAATSSSNGGGAAAAAAASSSSSTPPPPPPPPRANIPCRCPKIYDPVCGTDARTYSNECILNCVSANNVNNGFPAIAVKRRGACPRSPCNCPNTVKPVCGSDRSSYGNECLLRCENTRRKNIGLSPIKIVYNGVCKQNVCICSDNIIPVCGSDNRTYRNICFLQCTSRSYQLQGKPAIWWQYNGACKYESCICPAVSEPLCGSDKRTYKNSCALACQNRRLDQLGLSPIKSQYPGACVKNCRCPDVYDPLCASNGVTFANSCVLGCTNERRRAKKLSALTIKSVGVCPCMCTLQYDPMCASDDRTYANPCKVDCENKRRRDLRLRLLKIDHKGRCICNCGYCPRSYEPVCGNDARTYWNRCWLICNRNCNSDIGRPLYVVKNSPC